MTFFRRRRRDRERQQFPRAELFDLTRLPNPSIVRARLQALALFDAAFEGISTYSWISDREHGSVAYYDSGSGDSMSAYFSGDTAVVWGFNHESAMSPWANEGMEHWPGLFQGLPDPLARIVLAEPLFEGFRQVTFCYWREDSKWVRGAVTPPETYHYGDVEGAEGVLEGLIDGPAAVARLAEEYWERPELVVALDAVVRRLEAGQPIRTQDLETFDPELPLAALEDEAHRMGVAAS